MDLRREAGPKVQCSRLYMWGIYTPGGGGGGDCSRHNSSGMLTVATLFHPTLDHSMLVGAIPKEVKPHPLCFSTGSGSFCRMLVITPPKAN